MNIVWFKRDLRVSDHSPLASAVAQGRTLALYILEPLMWQEKDLDARHYEFLLESILDLKSQLKKINLTLTVKVGKPEHIFHQLHERFGIKNIYSHQETWNDWTYQRDKRVAKLLKDLSIPWHQAQQNGVIRRLRSRNGWARQWHQYMSAPLVEAPLGTEAQTHKSDDLPTTEEIGLAKSNCDERQTGGRDQGLQLLNSFFASRGEKYSREMSSPLTAYESCSRLSSHLAFGSLSVREVYQLALIKKTQINTHTEPGSPWRSSIRAFMSRLRWHCHFIQKLEDEPALEFKNIHPSTDGLREPHFDTKLFDAWKNGLTGYPFIDACMRALRATGWINFRMRAMLVSFASYHLWLHWREPSLHLARMFLDYEPGIHYSQIQMQSGTTGINAIRIYNPIKQGMDQDLEGIFIRKWVPELSSLSKVEIHTPWLANITTDVYPKPIIDEKIARREASSRIYSIRRSPKFKEISANIVDKHASRKKSTRTKKQKNTEPKKSWKQPELF
ncbi:MAG: deoxyribodipyrimidine photo-lyase/cryptochrome family protein [Burkholderiales bacterium]|nr:deoxyribodipyrimidine photo-lyase/cryptochrome family protein [Burkholderiales bacterium]